MPLITEKIDKILKEKNLTRYKLSKLIEYKKISTFYRIIDGKQTMSEDVINKIAPVLEISPEIIKGWTIADKYAKNLLKQALQTKQKQPEEKIFTDKIDEIIKQKGLSRNSLSELIGYSQGSLNDMITSKYTMSPQVIAKIAPILEISEEEIKSWIIADKYSLETLQAALEENRS